MFKFQKTESVAFSIVTLLALVNAVILQEALLHDKRLYWGLLVSIPILIVAAFNMRQRKYSWQKNNARKNELTYCTTMQPKLDKGIY